MRQRIIYRADNGRPLHKTRKVDEFKPPAKHAAKKDIAAKNFGLYEDEFDLQKEKEFFER